jgi:hypothetical protein
MAKKTAHGKGKHANQYLRGLDSCFLLQSTDLPGVLSFTVVASSPLLDNSNDSQPVTSRGLAILEPTSRVKIDLAVSSMESNVGLATVRGWTILTQVGSVTGWQVVKVRQG